MSMFQNFFMKAMLKKKLSSLPKAEQEKVMGALEKNPDFFVSIAKDIEARMKTGKDQTTATMEVMRERQAEIKSVIS